VYTEITPIGKQKDASSSHFAPSPDAGDTTTENSKTKNNPEDDVMYAEVKINSVMVPAHKKLDG